MRKTTVSAGGSNTTSGQLWSVQRGKGGKRNCSCHLKKKKRFKIEAEKEYCSSKRLFESIDYKVDTF